MVLKLFNFLARGGGRGRPPGGLNRVKARLSAKPLNSRVTHLDNERVCTWRPFFLFEARCEAIEFSCHTFRQERVCTWRPF